MFNGKWTNKKYGGRKFIHLKNLQNQTSVRVWFYTIIQGTSKSFVAHPFLKNIFRQNAPPGRRPSYTCRCAWIRGVWEGFFGIIVTCYLIFIIYHCHDNCASKNRLWKLHLQILTRRCTSYKKQKFKSDSMKKTDFWGVTEKQGISALIKQQQCEMFKMQTHSNQNNASQWSSKWIHQAA